MGAAPTVELDAPLDRPVTAWLQVTARFGNQQAYWTTTATAVEVLHTELLPLEVPPDAFLHPLASDYVTDVLVLAHFVDPEGRVQYERLRGYLDWSSGTPTLVDEAHLQAMAPLGITDAAVLEALPTEVELGSRVLPPLWDLVPTNVKLEGVDE